MNKRDLEQLLARSVTLCGMRHDSEGKVVDLDGAVKGFLKTMAALVPDVEEQFKILTEAWNDKSGELMSQLSAIRVEQVTNFIQSESMFMSWFFESTNLADNEEPYFINDIGPGGNEVRIGQLGEDGKPDRVRVVLDNQKTAITLKLFSSKIVRYKIRDLYKGQIVGDMSRKTLDIARDLRITLDRRCYTLLNATLANGGCYGPFSYENANTKRSTRLYLPHSVIRADQLPGGNDYNLLDGPQTIKNPLMTHQSGGAFGFPVLLAIQQYAQLWGSHLPDGGGRLIPTGEILVPNTDILAIAEANMPTVNVSSQRMQEDIIKDGFTGFFYNGTNWKFVPDVTIPGGTCFPRFNLVPGNVYTKSSQAREFVETNARENWEERSQEQPFGAYIISQKRPRGLRVKYY